MESIIVYRTQLGEVRLKNRSKPSLQSGAREEEGEARRLPLEVSGEQGRAREGMQKRMFFSAKG